MPGDVADGARQFRDLAVVLKQVGLDDLRRQLYKAINDTAKPLAEKIKTTAHLDPYMPNRYAAVLAGDLKVAVHKNAGVSNPGVTVVASAPTVRRSRGRQVQSLNAGIIRHPVFADRTVPRRKWHWKTQTGGMRPGFFTDPCEAAVPDVRDAIIAAMARVADKATGGA